MMFYCKKHGMLYAHTKKWVDSVGCWECVVEKREKNGLLNTEKPSPLKETNGGGGS